MPFVYEIPYDIFTIYHKKSYIYVILIIPPNTKNVNCLNHPYIDNKTDYTYFNFSTN